ncbi:MAG: hypothetical protein QMB65_08820, partial [Vicingaceae bacterium]
MNKIGILILFVVGSFNLTFASELEFVDVKSLLELVETEKDYQDAMDLIGAADNLGELLDGELKGEIIGLSKAYGDYSPDW